MKWQVNLPTLHADQLRAYETPGRYLAIRCGRRWGKTKMLNTISCNSACRGEQIGWFVPESKFRAEPWSEIFDILSPIRQSSSKTEGVFQTITGGKIDFWSLENDLAGRGRKYNKVIIDEAAFTKSILMLETWERNIEPTLLDYQGEAIVASNTNGSDPANFLYAVCNDTPVENWRGNGPAPGKRYGFVQYHAPTFNNPTIPSRHPFENEVDFQLRRRQVFEDLKAKTEPLVWQQEYLADFVDWSGVAFFSLAKMLVPGGPTGDAPAAYPRICDCVFATIDTATKTGREHDGTAVVYWALDPRAAIKLTVLDYDVCQIEGSLLEHWLPNVFHRLAELAEECRARMGSAGAFIEDKASGMILLQQAQRKGLPATAIDSKLTAVGKSERAINVSGYVFQENVKLSQHAFDKTVQYKGHTRNHLLAQVTGFRVGDKDQIDDDLLDAFTYGIAIGLGDEGGF